MMNMKEGDAGCRSLGRFFWGGEGVWVERINRIMIL